MRFTILPILLASFAACTPAARQEAAISCPLERAVYSEMQNGYEVRFREPKPWETTGMVEVVFDLVAPKGDQLWGVIASNMGTSRDEGRLYHGCPPPGPDGPTPDDVLKACQVWKGVVYAMANGEPDFVTAAKDDAPKALLLSDLGAADALCRSG